MNTILKKLEQRQLEKLTDNKNIPEFSAGDTIKVNVKIKEGSRERVQAFEGVCIARSGSGLDASFTVRKISLGEGVERVFPLYSPRLESIELVRRGSVRRAKLYYLRDRRGKSARISERTSGHGLEAGASEQDNEKELTQTAKRAAKKAEKEARRAEARKEQEKIKADKKAAKEAEKAAAKAEAEAQEAPAETPEENSGE